MMDNRTVSDLALASASISAPVWLEGANEWLTFVVLVLGAVLAVMRIYAMVKGKGSE
jgi:hypothetical protein